MVVLDRRLSKLEANQPPPPRRSLEEIEADINQLHAHLQNQIFLPTVQISPDLILFS